jgi:hypothetical protein
MLINDVIDEAIRDAAPQANFGLLVGDFGGLLVREFFGLLVGYYPQDAHNAV